MSESFLVVLTSLTSNKLKSEVRVWAVPAALAKACKSITVGTPAIAWA